MKIFNYFTQIKERINRINKYTTNPMNYEDLNNPFASTMPKTYVWIDEEKQNK